ncbi:MAG: class I SAM-dependent methyltransferase [Patescibacteria group bacterium]
MIRESGKHAGVPEEYKTLTKASWGDPRHFDRFRKVRAETTESMKSLCAKLFEQFFNNQEPIIELGAGDGALKSITQDSRIIETENSEAIFRSNNRLYEGNRVRADALKLPFGDESLANVLSLASFDTLFDDDLATAFSELRRVLKPGGRFLHLLDLRPNSLVILDQFMKMGKIPIPYLDQGNMRYYTIHRSRLNELFEYINRKEGAQFAQNIRENLEDPTYIHQLILLEHGGGDQEGFWRIIEELSSLAGITRYLRAEPAFIDIFKDSIGQAGKKAGLRILQNTYRDLEGLRTGAIKKVLVSAFEK